MGIMAIFLAWPGRPGRRVKHAPGKHRIVINRILNNITVKIVKGLFGIF
jgi:hypothetical protein